MFYTPGYSTNVSLALSEILEDIGVNENIITKTRRTGLLTDSLLTTGIQLLGEKASLYMLGSRAEGSTTSGLQSDTDIVKSLNDYNIIEDWGGWKRGLTNYLMIRDENVSPGYCMLQCLRDDAPLPLNNIHSQHHFKDWKGRIVLKNTCFDDTFPHGHFKQGPAYTVIGLHNSADTDCVIALPSEAWPVDAADWLTRQNLGMWPSEDLTRHCINSRCFVVPVGHKGSDYEKYEWRISTSLAERALMYSLNSTHIKCYVLLKTIVKHYIKPHFKDAVTSFICKTVLFHCIANTPTSIWRKENLLVCVMFCVHMLHRSIENEYCPHFIIHENNLIRGRISREIKPQILKVLYYITCSKGRALLDIKCHKFGTMIELKLNGLYGIVQNLQFPKLKNQDNSTMLLEGIGILTNGITNFYNFITTPCSCKIVLQKLYKYVFKLVHLHNETEGPNRRACSLLTPLFCLHLGCVLASVNIHLTNSISQEALTLASMGFKSDVSSGKLKLASILYCTGDLHSTVRVLREIEECYDIRLVENLCACYTYRRQLRKLKYYALAVDLNEDSIPEVIAYCVRFLPSEINCVPLELRHEMLRSTAEDLQYRGPCDYWMDWAVVDSLPFLYFLQYKTYGMLRMRDEKHRALNNLVRTTANEKSLCHRETALNLLGQLMEQEDRARDAFNCYIMSLKLRERNNAAKFHVCRLLSTVINQN